MAQFVVFKQDNTISILGLGVCLNFFKEVIDCWDHEEVNYHLPHLTCKQVFQVLNAWNTMAKDTDLYESFIGGNNAAYEEHIEDIIKYLRYRANRDDFWDYNK